MRRGIKVPRPVNLPLAMRFVPGHQHGGQSARSASCATSFNSSLRSAAVGCSASRVNSARNCSATVVGITLMRRTMHQYFHTSSSPRSTPRPKGPCVQAASQGSLRSDATPASYSPATIRANCQARVQLPDNLARRRLGHCRDRTCHGAEGFVGQLPWV